MGTDNSLTPHVTLSGAAYSFPSRSVSVDELAAEGVLESSAEFLKDIGFAQAVSYTHLTLPTTPYV